MKKKRAIITILSFVVIILIVRVCLWGFSVKTSSIQMSVTGVVVNLNTWEVLSQVDVQFDGTKTYTNQFSGKLSKFEGNINLNLHGVEPKEVAYKDCSLYCSKYEGDKRAGSIRYFKGGDDGKITTAGIIFTEDSSLKQFALHLCDDYSNSELFKTKSNTCIIAPANNKEEAQRIYSMILEN